MIEVNGLVKTFSRWQVLKNITFSARPGELITLLGPNGAGKTTLLRILCGYMAPDEGNVTVDGQTYGSNRLEILRHIGYMPENTPLYPEMTVGEYLRFIGNVFKMWPEDFSESFGQMAEGLGIKDVLGQKIQTLSKGYRRRVGIASVLLHRPRLAVLDEPTEGLDPNQKIEVRHFLRRYAENNLVLISTHLLEEAEALSSRVLLLSGGRLKLDAPVDDLRKHSTDGTLADAFYRLTGKTGEE